MDTSESRQVRLLTSFVIFIVLALIFNIADTATQRLNGGARWIPIGVLVTAVALFSIFFHTVVRRYLLTVRFASALILFLCCATMLGTFVLQRVSREEFVASYSEYFGEHRSALGVMKTFGLMVDQRAPEGMPGDHAVQVIPPENRRFLEGAHVFLSSIGFIDVFHSYWFIGLTFVLAASLLLCVLLRRPWRRAQIGFVATHVSLLVLFLGAFIGTLFGVKGFMWLGVGETSAVYRAHPNQILDRGGKDREVTLPFEVACDDFILEKYEDRYKLYVYTVDPHGKMRKPYPLEFGSRLGAAIPVKGSPYTVTVEKQFKNYEETRAYAAADKNGVPAVQFTLFPDAAGAGHGSQTWLAQGEAATIGGRKILFTWELPPEMAAEVAASAPSKPAEGAGASKDAPADATRAAFSKSAAPPQFAQGIITVRRAGAEIRLRAETGQSATIGTPPVRVEVTGVFPDYVRLPEGKNGSRSDQPNNPAAELKLSGPGAEEIVVAFSKPEFKEFTKPRHFQGMTFDFEFGTAPAARTDLTLVGSTTTLVARREGRLVVYPLTVNGAPVPVEPGGPAVRLDAVLPKATPETQVRDSMDPGHNPAIELTVSGAAGASNRRVLVGDLEQHIALGDDQLFLLYRKQFKEPKDYKSVLRIIDHGRVVRTKTIEVNDPLTYKGYHFYQSSYDSNTLARTGLQIVRDPGLPLVYIGFFLMLAGMIFTFYLKSRVSGSGGQGNGKTPTEG